MTDTNPTTLPEIYVFADDKSYRADPGYNWSAIKTLVAGLRGATSAATLRHRLDVEKPAPTSAMVFGTLVHTVVLEPDKADDIYYVMDGSKRTKAWKEAAKEAAEEGKELVHADDMAAAIAMRDAVSSNPAWRLLLEQCEKTVEVGMACNDSEYNIRIKGKYDVLLDDELMVDLKTTSSTLDYQQLQRDVLNFGYHAQMALYWRILRQLRPELTHTPSRMAWLFVSKEAPHETVLLHADDEVVEHAEAIVDELLRGLAYSDRHNYWPPRHPTGAAVMSLPGWARKALESTNDSSPAALPDGI